MSLLTEQEIKEARPRQHSGKGAGMIGATEHCRPLVPDARIVEIIRGYIAAQSTSTTRPDMSNEHHLLALGQTLIDEACARLPLWLEEIRQDRAAIRELKGKG